MPLDLTARQMSIVRLKLSILRPAGRFLSPLTRQKQRPGAYEPILIPQSRPGVVNLQIVVFKSTR